MVFKKNINNDSRDVQVTKQYPKKLLFADTAGMVSTIEKDNNDNNNNSSIIYVLKRQLKICGYTHDTQKKGFTLILSTH